MIIRQEKSKDFRRIEEITQLAFEGKPYSAGDEQYLAQNLRDAGALSVSLVSEIDGDVVGHIAISEVLIDGKEMECYGIGPLAIHPNHQGKGIGTKLMQCALDEIKNSHAKTCVLVGDPNFYSRVGFTVASSLTYKDAPAEYFQFLSFIDGEPHGEVTFHSAFDS